MLLAKFNYAATERIVFCQTVDGSNHTGVIVFGFGGSVQPINADPSAAMIDGRNDASLP
ncbi:MAG: hypothetical protein LBH00_09310 [Planctomycetaceae bacterium]|jgi:hypothetical protein|nr:hypothetical protein [Planctomycetaceae bacterium]